MKLLPWEYAVRNLFRRPLRTLLTFTGLTIVIVLIFVVVGFIRGLQRSLAVTGDPQAVVVFSQGMGSNLEYSSIPMSTGELLSASIPGIQERYGQKYVSPELYLGSLIGVDGQQEPAMGLVRGVTPKALLVRRQLEVIDGAWPEAGEVMVGRMAVTKLSASAEAMAIGKTLDIEGRSWRISGIFAAGGAAFESEVWCGLHELQVAMKREDLSLSLVALTLTSDDNFSDLQLFCAARSDLALAAEREVAYYASLQEDYQPVRMLAWLVVSLVSGAGVFAGLNTMYGAVIGRTSELSMLQTIGFARRAVVVSLVQEGLMLAAAASLLATALAIVFVNGAAVRFTMGAFSIHIDNVAMLIGCGVGLLLGVFGAIPPAIRALRMPIVEGLKAI